MRLCRPVLNSAACKANPSVLSVYLKRYKLLRMMAALLNFFEIEYCAYCILELSVGWQRNFFIGVPLDSAKWKLLGLVRNTFNCYVKVVQKQRFYDHGFAHKT